MCKILNALQNKENRDLKSFLIYIMDKFFIFSFVKYTNKTKQLKFFKTLRCYSYYLVTH